MNSSGVIAQPIRENAIFCQRILRQIDDPEALPQERVDFLDIAWNERGLRSLRRTTRNKRLVRVILPADEELDHGDVIVETPEAVAIVINLLPCDALTIRSEVRGQLAQFAYLIGNAHLPAEIRADEILIPATTSTAAALGQLKIPFSIETRRIRIDPDGLPMVTVSPNVAIRSNARPPARP
jgi:urease accessory protein UreE